MERKIKCPHCGTDTLSWRVRCQQCGEELHKGEDRIPEFERRGAWFWFPFILGLAGTGFLLGLLFFALAFALLGLLAIPLIGLGLSWKWPLVGGIILILVGVTFIIWMIIVGGMDEPSGIALTLLTSVPFLLSGILFILSRK